MFKKKEGYLLLFVIIFIIIVAIIYRKSNNKNYNIPRSISEKKSSYRMEYLDQDELKDDLKDFYEISIEEDERDYNVSKKIYNNEKNQSKPKLSSYIDNIYRLLDIKDNRVNELDKIIIEFLKNPNIRRKEKIDALWEMIKKVNISSNKGIYLLDYLDSLHPIEISNEIISIYSEQENDGVKLRIIDLLTNSLSIANPNLQSKKELDFIATKAEEIQSFLYDEITNSTDLDIFSKALNSYSNISTSEEAQDMINSVINGGTTVKIDDKKIISYLTEIAISTEESQQNILPDIINSIENGSVDIDKKKIFDETILNILNDESSKDIFTSESKSQLLEYLNKKEPKLSISENISIENLEKYYSWINSKSKLEDTDNNNFMEKSLFNIDNPLKISSIILYSDDNFIKNIKKNSEIEDIYNILSSSLENEEMNNKSKNIIKDALKLLKER